MSEPTRDRSTTGLPVSKFRVLNDAEGGELPAQFEVTAWRKLANDAYKKLERGQRVEVTGHWEADKEFDYKDGTPGREAYQFTADGIDIEIGEDQLVKIDKFDPAMLETGSVADGGQSVAG